MYSNMNEYQFLIELVVDAAVHLADRLSSKNAYACTDADGLARHIRLCDLLQFAYQIEEN